MDLIPDVLAALDLNRTSVGLKRWGEREASATVSASIEPAWD